MTLRDDELRADGLLDEIERLVAVAPSAAFSEGVRSRIARPSRGRGASTWMLFAAATLAVGAFALSSPALQQADPIPVVTQRVTTTAAAPSRQVEPQRPTVVTSRPASPATLVRVSTKVDAEDLYLVVSNQRDLLRDALATFAWSRLSAAAEAEETAPAATPDLTKPFVLDPIEVAPIVVSAFGGQMPAIRRLSAAGVTK